MQKRQSQPPPTNPHYPHQQKSEMANENADQFDERSIEEICSEIGDGLTKMQKDLKELNEENGKMKKEIRELKVENEKLNEEMANIWKEIGSGKKKNGTNEWENVEERNSRE
jgi:septal ring factor EnvC (AmiA/AmiB activator)